MLCLVISISIFFDLRKEERNKKKECEESIEDGRIEVISGWIQGVLGGEVIVPGELHEVH